MSWWLGYCFGLLLLVDSMFLPEPLSAITGLMGVFLWVAVCVNYYGKK
jgi:hypothetical protein